MMLTLKKIKHDGYVEMYRGQELIAPMSETNADIVVELEKQNQEMSMLLRMMVSGRDVKEKAAKYLSENNLNNPLR